MGDVFSNGPPVIGSVDVYTYSRGKKSCCLSVLISLTGDKMTYLDWREGYKSSDGFTSDVKRYLSMYGPISVRQCFTDLTFSLPSGFRKLVS